MGRGRVWPSLSRRRRFSSMVCSTWYLAAHGEVSTQVLGCSCPVFGARSARAIDLTRRWPCAAWVLVEWWERGWGTASDASR